MVSHYLFLLTEGEKVAELTETFENASGAAQDLADKRFDTLEGDTLALGSAWEGFLLSIEDGNGIINKIQRAASTRTYKRNSRITSNNRVFKFLL